ncbi:conserved hypothetical protein [Methylocella tundrae]|uniref:PepSY domain-containing protein n=2 Tax=Methylocella tundrae TaxID=227605 RepID=A0A8B6M7K4_METTU|nr:conserved hypothetical protein [Methylocella tundrae]VTZ50826.1 conserved hypothetical protein [Methylocella tundrae]
MGVLISSLVQLTCVGFCVAALAQPLEGRRCFSTGETREKIGANELSEPFRAMQKAAARLQAEALGAKLCRWSDAFVYEISLLRRDGRIIRTYVDAKTGQIIETKNEKKHED